MEDSSGTDLLFRGNSLNLSLRSQGQVSLGYIGKHDMYRNAYRSMSYFRVKTVYRAFYYNEARDDHHSL